MAYKLIIADDEDIIRSGIVSVIDWHSLGFEVVADFDDGGDAMEYIRHHSVDVVLTDIRMSRVSGLELAEFVCQSKPGTKVVLISGYKDFDYAKQAIRYQVTSYITKPLHFEEIYTLFQDIRQTLDKELEEKIREMDQSKRFKELLPLMQEEFLSDLLLGVLRSPVEMERRIRMLELNMNVAASPCCVVQLEIQHLEQYLLGRWKQGKDDLRVALQHFLRGEADGIGYYPVISHRKEMALLAIASDSLEYAPMGSGIAEQVNRYLGERQQSVRQMLGLELQFHIQSEWSSIQEMAAHAGRIAGSSPIGGIESDRQEEAVSTFPEFLRSGRSKKLAEMRELFMPYVHAGDREAAGNLMDGYLLELRGVPYSYIRHYLSELFASIALKLQAVGLDLWEIGNGYHSCYDLDNAPWQEQEPLRVWCRSKLDEILSVTTRQRASTGSWALEKAEQYIRDNYQRDISLEDVAGQVFLSSAYFSQMFKEGKGINYSDYLVRIRMEKAMELLTESNYKILEISQMVGYRSSKYFARCFKKAYGCTPTEYQMQLNRGARQ